ncbi:MAG: carboxymuconolactone decarboxylase family protein [Caulobacteraceae bacterium]
MSRIHTPAIDTATGETAEIYAQVKKGAGRVPNAYAAVGAYSPAILKTVLQAEGVLAASSLNKKDRETVKLVISEVAGCDYCVAAHTALGKMAGLADETMNQVRHDQPTGDTKRDALAHFVRTLAKTNGTIAESEFEAIKAAGYTDQNLVEISFAIALITFTNVFNRINDTDIDFPKVS